MKNRSLILPLLFASSACRSQVAEPAPPPARFELVLAPPGARGARAAGTDAAPPAPSEFGGVEPGGEMDDDLDGGSEQDAAITVPDSDAGVAL